MSVCLTFPTKYDVALALIYNHCVPNYLLTKYIHFEMKYQYCAPKYTSNNDHLFWNQVFNTLCQSINAKKTKDISQ